MSNARIEPTGETPDGMKPRLTHRWMKQMLKAGLGLLFPDRCAGCGKIGTLWCETCDKSVLRITPPVCEQCGEPIRRKGYCRRCSVAQLSIQVRSYAVYQGSLMKLILQIKYRKDIRLMELLGGWLADMVRSLNWSPSLVTAVPLGRKRQRTRGFNQAGLIAEALAAQLAVPYAGTAIIRMRETRSQVGLNAVEREVNVRDAFRGERRIVKDKRILLVDDLFTTGATLTACAGALYAVDAAEVRAVTVARAMSRERNPKSSKGVVHDR